MPGEDAESTSPSQSVADNELAAYLDGTLSPERRRAVESLLDVDRRALEAVAVCAAKPGDDPQPRLYPGARVGRLQVLRRIATGGMGSVYEAYDPQLERRLALKFPRQLAADAGKIETEARLLAAIAHPNVVTVHDVGRYGERVYMTMEFLDGLDLRTHLRSEPMTWRTIVALYRQVAEALVAVHGAGLVHRDVKPDNILVERVAHGRLARPRAVMVDFGLATAVGVPATLAGTPSYLAPELLAGASPTEASDQFAFSVSMLEALTGRTGDSLGGLPGPVDAVPRRVLACVRRGCAEHAEQRHPSMRAMIAAIDRAQEGRVGGAALVVGFCLSGALVFGLATRAEPPPSFCPIAVETDALDDRIARVEARFEAEPEGYVRELGPKVSTRIRERRDVIASGRLDNCEQRRGGEISRSEWQARQRCFDRRTRELLAVSDELSDGGSSPALLAAAPASLGALEHPASCASVAGSGQPTGADEGYALLAAAALTMRAGDESRTREHLESAAETLAGDRDGELGVLYRRAKWLEIQGDYDGAAQLLSDAVLEAERSGDAKRIASFMIEQVWVEGYRKQDFERGREIATHARAWLERSNATEEQAFELDLDLGWLELSAGEPARAMDHFRASEELLDAPGLDGRDASLVANGLGSAELALGRPESAAGHLTRSLEALEGELGALHPDVGQVRNNLAAVVRSLGRFEEARRYFDANLETFRGAYGPQHPFVGITLLNRATLFVDLGDLVRAEQDARSAIVVYEGLAVDDGSHEANLARARKVLADVLIESGGARALTEAGRLLEQVVEQQVRSHGPRNPLVAEVRHAQARWHAARGDEQAAIEHAEAAAAIIVEALGEEHPSLAPILVTLGVWKDDPVSLERAAAVAGPVECAEAHVAWAERLAADGHRLAARRHARWAEACDRQSPTTRGLGRRIDEVRARLDDGLNGVPRAR